jgi:hypothetical protein
MTKRSIFIGLLLAVLMGAWGQYAGKYIPGSWGLIRGHLPVSVFGALILFVMAINPLLRKIRAGLALRPAEIAIIMALTLVGCAIADAGMMRYFPRQLITPIQQAQVKSGWRATEVLSYTPPAMLANGGAHDQAVIDGFYSASGTPDRVLPFLEVPWRAWWKPLTLWSTLIACFMLGSICLAVVVHRQWADKERLRYPLAEIVSTLLRKDETGRPQVFGNRIFWIGMAIPFVVRMINFIGHWVPGSIEIPLAFDFSALRDAFPTLMQTPNANYFASPRIFPAVIGLTYLLASDIGLSLSVANVLSVAVLYAMLSHGVNLSGSDMQGGYLAWQTFGAYLGMACMIVYGGRRYYWQTLKASVGFRLQSETHAAAVRALRLFLFFVALAVTLLACNGMDWSVALLAWGVMTMIVFVCARMNAECATFSLEPGWQMPGILIGLFGLTVLGPQIVIIAGLLMVLVQVEVIESMMPFVVNGLKISADNGEPRTGKTGLLLAAGFLLAMAVTVPTALWADYHHPAALLRGADGAAIWDTASRAITQTTLAGESVMSEPAQGFARWARMQPDSRFLAGASIGFCALIALSVMRLRFSWWPFHPILVLVFGTWFAARFGFSFFLGWCVKTGIMKYGGGQVYARAKPAAIGLIVGDLAGGFVMMAISGIYYLVTGLQAPQIWRTVLW